MKQFEHIICNQSGIHARPAGQIVSLASKYESEIILSTNEKIADAKKIFEIMLLSVKMQDLVCVQINGRDEEEAFSEIKSFFNENL